jgi:hypothetical protein
MSNAQDRWDAAERNYKSERDTPVMAQNRAYTEAFRHGVIIAVNDCSRATATKMASIMPVAEGDAFLAGYYAGLRRLRNYEDLERI